MPTGNCSRSCWIAGAVLGLLVWIFTAGLGPLRWYEGLFLGIIAAGLMGRFLLWLLCDGVQAEGGEAAEPIIPAELMEKVTSTASTLGQKANDLVGGDKGKTTGSTETPSASGPRSAFANAEAAGGGADAEEKAVKSASKDKSKTKGKAKVPSDEKPASSPASAETEGQPDDLKQIKGVGPKLEELLHENGVTRFSQIAEWSDAEMDRFAELIGRMGSRIRSDDWVGQARTLAAGGETEFSQRVDKGDVY